MEGEPIGWKVMGETIACTDCYEELVLEPTREYCREVVRKLTTELMQLAGTPGKEKYVNVEGWAQNLVEWWQERMETAFVWPLYPRSFGHAPVACTACGNLVWDG